MKNDIFYWIKCVFVGFLSILLLNLIILSVRVNLSYSEYDALIRKEITSVDIYTAVMDNGIKSLEDFKRYLSQKGIEL